MTDPSPPVPMMGGVRVVSCQSSPGVQCRCGRGGRRWIGGNFRWGFGMSKQVVPGPGTLRVGRFIGRLGVVSIPAVEVGLDLDQRVVRRHVAKLEAAGWLARAPWIWGEGSVVWLTGAGIEGAGLGGVRAVKSPPGATTIAHGVLVGWSAARVEHRGRVWKSARELALERERWAVSMRCERGYTEQLPDLAVWLKRSAPPVAVIAESGGRREDRQKMILEGWRDGILSGRYAGCPLPLRQRVSRALDQPPSQEGPADRSRVRCGRTDERRRDRRPHPRPQRP